MLKKVLKIILFFVLIILGLVLVAIIFFKWPVNDPGHKVEIGVTFSSRHAESLKLDWKDNYLAILDDLKIRKIRIPVYWDLVEKTEGEYDFSEIDWQLEEGRKRNAEIVLAIGQKVPRWPECFVPEWTKGNDMKRKARLILFLRATVERYKNNPEIKYWQVENEPFLSFGICPPLDINLLDWEIETVKRKDPSRPIIITDSGELSVWIPAAKRANVFGTTMYLDVYTKYFGHFKYPIGPNFFRLKKWVIEKFANQNNSVVIELQAEPWLDEWVLHAPLEKQLKAVNSDIIKDNVSLARKSGFSEAYLWGVEWWYWLKTEKKYPEIWDSVKEMVRQN